MLSFSIHKTFAMLYCRVFISCLDSKFSKSVWMKKLTYTECWAELPYHLNCKLTWRQQRRFQINLFLASWRCPGPRLECVSSAYRVLTEFSLSKLCGRSMTFDLSLNRLGHQTFLMLFGLQGFIPLLCLWSSDFDLLPVAFVL